MKAETARELFSGAYDGELTSEEREAFDALLASDEDLRQEYAEFCDFLKETAMLGSGEDELPEIDLLPAVQRKISERSRGRYFRQKVKRDQNQLTLAITIVLVFVFIGIVIWFGMSVFEHPSEESTSSVETTIQATESPSPRSATPEPSDSTS